MRIFWIVILSAAFTACKVRHQPESEAKTVIGASNRLHPQLTELVDRVTASFDSSEFERFYYFKFNERLGNVVATANSFRQVVEDTVRYLGRRQKLGEFCAFLVQERPTRSDLRATCSQVTTNPELRELVGIVPQMPTAQPSSSSAPARPSTPAPSQPTESSAEPGSLEVPESIAPLVQAIRSSNNVHANGGRARILILDYLSRNEKTPRDLLAEVFGPAGGRSIANGSIVDSKGYDSQIFDVLNYLERRGQIDDVVKMLIQATR